MSFMLVVTHAIALGHSPVHDKVLQAFVLRVKAQVLDGSFLDSAWHFI